MYVEDALKQVFETFEPDVLIDFFRTIGVRTLNPLKRNYDIQADASFFCIPYLLGTIRLENEEELAVFTIKVVKSLTERSGKKAQYELAKKILKTENRYPAGIFIFHDDKNDFRFSLVYSVPLATGKRDWSNFRRYTYFVSKEQTNKTFIHQIAQADFSSIETLTEAFSVEKVTKAFYAELQNWYFWAMNIVEFPDDEDKDKNSRNAKNLIRLITRIIFIWFMKEKRLIPSSLFEKQFVDNLLNYNDKTGSTYYKAILQNLFFATLNTKMRKDDSKSRIFVEDAQKMGYISDAYLQQGYYRYSRFIKDKEKFIKEFENIPFLNGGLFECLDKKIDEKEVRIDCFSDNPKNETRLKVPDVIFFSEEEVDADLSAFLENNNRRKVRGLIPILNNYNFTTDENTPIDEEVALDPELLGKVFENLLASYNPETAVTARKATGSYYTPREIVDYMVTESLVMHLAGTLGDEPKTIEKLNKLFSYSDDSNLFDAEETESIISSIEKIRILDPACGSGAFPMGILHKLVLALHKLDPQNTKWKKRLIEGVPPELQAEVEQSLQNKSLDYIRKLGLIEHCIFGVDIQEIAIQISKLRFFISLLIEQDVDDSKENCDIRALPNLETKFVAANTLIELGESQYLKSQEVINLEEELFNVRERIFYTNSRKEKHELQRKLTDIRNQLKTELAKVGFPNDKAEKITQWDPFDQNTHAEWFDPEWMFGIKKEEVKKTLKAFNITWVTHNSRRREFDMPSLTHGEKPIILNFEERNIIAQLLAQRIKEKKYRILAMNVLSDHVHLLLISDQKDVPTIVGDLKGYVSRMFHSLASASATTGTTASVSVSVSATHGLTRGLQESQSSDSQSGATYSDGTQLKLWARGYSDTFIDNDLHFANAITYIEHNHIKHELPSIDFSLVKDALTPSENAFAPIYMETGFDIVVGNPPYVSTKEVSENDKKILEKQFGFADDLYNHFYFKGMYLLNEKGILTFISSKTFWTIQTKKNLRELILRNQLLQLFDTANPFDTPMVDTCVILIQKCSNPPENYLFKYLDGTKSIINPEVYVSNIEYYKNAPNQVFFSINDYNIKVYERYGKKVNKLLSQWWDKISTSKNIEKNKTLLDEYRKSLKPGDVTLLGLITEGGQGLATANNGKYVGVKEGTKWAENVKKQRPEKLLLAAEFCRQNNIKNKWDADAFINKLNESEIRKLFDDIKEKYGRDILGQGWLYRIVTDDEIADVDLLTDDDKINGITGDKTFVPYDKGDKDGNRWYAPTPYYIDWSRENVKFLKENSGKKGKGMPVVRNPQFYFREGFCWNNVLNPNATMIKSRIKLKSINDVGSMSLYSVKSFSPNYYFVSILNSYILFFYYRNFINYSVNIQINDIRQLPTIIPNAEQLHVFENIFNRAVAIQKDKFSGKISEMLAEKELDKIQKELDKFVEEMYLK